MGHQGFSAYLNITVTPAKAGVQLLLGVVAEEAGSRIKSGMTTKGTCSHCNKVALILFTMRGLLTFLAAVLAATPVLAQALAEPAQDAIAAVRSFTDAFDRADEAGMTSVIIESAQVVLVRPREDGDTVRSLPLAQLAANIASSPADLKEPIAIKNVMVDGPVAMVWADFSLFVDGTRSHCGVDIFTLVQQDGAWKIATITYSHITEPCEEAPAL